MNVKLASYADTAGAHPPLVWSPVRLESFNAIKDRVRSDFHRNLHHAIVRRPW